MRERYSLLVYFLMLLGNLVYGEDYISSGIYSEDEVAYIEELQGEQLKIGVYKGSRFLDQKQPEESLVYKYEKLMEEFFHLDMEVRVDSWEHLYRGLEAGEVDLLLNLVVTREREKEFNLTTPIYENKIYITAKNEEIPLDSWNDLEGKEIAVLKSSYYSAYLEKFREENYIDFRIIEVDSAPGSGEYNYAVLPSEKLHEKYNLKKLEMGDGEPMGIGIARDKPHLKEILNKALEYKLKDNILNLMKGDRVRRIRRDFYELLSPEEMEYLKNKESIEVFYEDDFYPMVYYDKNKEEYDGIFVRGLSQLSKLLGKPVEVLNRNGESWDEIYGRFKGGEGDLLPMYFTFERAKVHDFSRSMDYREMLLVGNSRKGHEKNLRIGVVEDDITEEASRRYITEEREVILYGDSEEMMNALKRGIIGSCIMDEDMFVYFNQTRFDLRLEKLKTLGHFPLCFAFQNGNGLLVGIVKKAGDHLINYSQVKSEFLEDRLLAKVAKNIANKRKKKLIRELMFLLVGAVGFTVLINRYSWNRKLHKLAYFDQLTAALNRASFSEELGKLDFKGNQGVGMYIDLNGFKQINDKYGHHTGDLILKEMVRRLHRLFKRREVFRLAGDEFFVLQRNTSLAGSMEAAQRTVEELEKPINLLDSKVGMGVSVGMCEVGSGVRDSQEFIHWADVAMYSAKKDLKDSIVVATERLVMEFDGQKNLMDDFKRALIKEEITAHFQPKVDLSSGKITGLEALARWKHEEKGFISPGTFIPMAEELGLVSKVDFIIAEATIKALKNWKTQGVVSESFKASFNVSVRTFEDVDVYENLKFLLEKHGVSGESVEVEVTESVFINKLSKVVGELSCLKDELGMTVALDDFTAGHSSLRELGKLSIDTLKFDRGLLQGIKENAKRGKIIYSNLINLCNDMGYTSVAEGIEEAWERDFLKREGVSHGQGYYFGKPMPEDAFSKILREGSKA